MNDILHRLLSLRYVAALSLSVTFVRVSSFRFVYQNGFIFKRLLFHIGKSSHEENFSEFLCPSLQTAKRLLPLISQIDSSKKVGGENMKFRVTQIE